MKFIICCWLLVALAATTALAQMPSRKKTIRKHTVARRRVPKAVVVPPREPWRCPGPLLPPIDEYVHWDGGAPSAVELPDSNRAYTYVEQMPTLNGQAAMPASIAAIAQYLVVPVDIPTGRVFVRFEVTRQGYVSHPVIAKGLRADLDSAVVAAARRLPRFSPGKQNGRVVPVSLTLPISIPARAQP